MPDRGVPDISGNTYWERRYIVGGESGVVIGADPRLSSRQKGIPGDCRNFSPYLPSFVIAHDLLICPFEPQVSIFLPLRSPDFWLRFRGFVFRYAHMYLLYIIPRKSKA